MASDIPQESASCIAPLTNENFDEYIESFPAVVIHFWAAWNRHDQAMRKMIESELSKRFAASVRFASVDVDPPAHRQLCVGLRIVQVPTLVVYARGKLAGTVVGLRDADNIEFEIRAALATD